MNRMNRSLPALLAIVVFCSPQAASRDADARQQLIAYLNSLATPRLEARRQAMAAITTRAAAERRRTEVRAKLLAEIGGIPERAPNLQVKTFGSVTGDGFQMEKVATRACRGSGSRRICTFRRTAPAACRRSCSHPVMARAARARTGAGAPTSRATASSCWPMTRSARGSGCSTSMATSRRRSSAARPGNMAKRTLVRCCLATRSPATWSTMRSAASTI